MTRPEGSDATSASSGGASSPASASSSEPGAACEEIFLAHATYSGRILLGLGQSEIDAKDDLAVGSTFPQVAQSLHPAKHETLPRELSEERLDELLGLWERWMRESATHTLELGPALNCASFNGIPWGYWEHTFTEMADAAEYSQAETIDVAINNLEVPYQQAVYAKHLYAVFRWQRASLEELYLKARELLRKVLPSKGVI